VYSLFHLKIVEFDYSSSDTLTVLAYTVVLKYPIEKSKGFKSGQHVGQETGASLLQLVQIPG
jgi:hypothetical protein